jgi:hypothetical protein
MKTKIVFALAILIGFQLNAQTVKSDVLTTAWTKYSSDMTIDNITYGGHTSREKIIYTSATEAVFPVSYPKGSRMIVMHDLKYTYGLVKMNNKGKQIWEQKLDGTIVNISKLGNNILAICSDQETDRDVTKEVKGFLLNATDGKIIKQSILYTNPVKKYIEVAVFNKKDDSPIAFTIRTTEWSGGLSGKYKKQLRSTEKLDIYSVNENLQPTMVNSFKPDEDLEFMRSDMADNGNLFLLFMKDKQIIAEKYAPGSKTPEKLSIAYDPDISGKQKALFLASPINSDNAYCVLNLEEKIRYVVFRFDKKSVVEKTDELNKDYAAKLVSSNDAPGEIEKRDKIKQIGSLEADYLGFYKNMVIVGKEFRYMGQDHVVDYETLISVFDQDLLLKKDFIVTKSFGSGSAGYGDNYHVEGDNLYFIGNSVKSMKVYPVFASISLKDLKWNKQVIIKNTDGKPADDLIMAENTIWFSTGFLVDRRDWKFGKGISNGGFLQLATYD